MRVKLLAVAAAVLPVAVFIGLLHGPALSLATQRQIRRAELSELRENVYREAWLDSSEAALRSEVETLRGFRSRVGRALIPEVATVADPLRQEAQSLGCEVIRVSPSQDSVGGLRRLRLRFEARADFASALRFFRALRLRHPEAYPEEALLRRGASPGSKLDLNLTLVFHLSPARGTR